jgi:dihydroneopterin aldolase
VTLTVVKVGGSFAHYRRLAELASALAGGGGRVVVVPGGGPFADCVRKEQPRIGFDDRAAHRMALLAMAEFGYALASLSPMLVPAPSLAAVRDIVGERAVPVWLPFELLESRADVPENWHLTSDSLSVWLCRRIAAGRLIFLKRAAPPAEPSLSDLSTRGILDPLVVGFLAGAEIETWLCGPRHIAALGRALAASVGAGQRISQLEQA